MDPHDDFDKHDRPPYDISPFTNTSYAELRRAYASAIQDRDKAIAALVALSEWADLEAKTTKMWMYQANHIQRIAETAIAKTESN